MADVVFNLSVVGAETSVGQINAVKTALSGVDTSLNNTAASADKASGSLTQHGQSSSGAAAQSGLLYSATGQVVTATNLESDATRAARDAVQGASSAHGGLQTALGATTGKSHETKIETDTLAGSLGLSRQGFNELTRVAREFVGALGEAVPAIGQGTAEFAKLSRGTGDWSVIGGVATVGAFALATALGAWIEQANRLTEAQHAANKAVSELDMAAAQSQLEKATDASEAYSHALETMDSETTTVAQRIGAELTVLGNTFTDFTGINRTAADAVAELWRRTGEGVAILQTMKVELQAEGAALKNIAESATSIDGLTAALGREAEVTYESSLATVELKRVDDERYRAKLEHQIEVVKGQGDEVEAMILQDQLEDAMALRERQRIAESTIAEEQLTAAKRKNAEQVAALAAEQVRLAGQLRDVSEQMAIQAEKTGQAEVDARYRAAQANAAFYGAANTLAPAYYDGLARSIQSTSDLEIQRIQDRARADVEALTIRRDALPAYSNAWQKANTEIELKDAETQLAIQTKSDETRVKLIENQTAELAAIRAAYSNMLSMAETFYATQTALGQENAVQHLATLKAHANDENLSFQERQKYAVAAYQGYQRLDQELFDMRKALGQTTQLDEVRRLADLVSQTAAGSEARIQAETKWANAATRLREDASSAALRLMNLINDQLKAEGNQNATLNELYEAGGRQRIAMLGEMNQGMALQFDRFKEINAMAGGYNQLTQVGVDLQTGMNTALGLTRDQLQGIRGPLGEAGTQFGALGTAALGLDPQLDAVSADFAEMGSKMSTSLQNAYTEGIAATKKFFEDLDQEIQTGASRTADRIYQGLINRIKSALDAEALAS